MFLQGITKKSGDMTNILGDVTQVPSEVTSGELTSGRLDRKPSTVTYFKPDLEIIIYSRKTLLKTYHFFKPRRD